ncbi:MAG TPA: TolC family protein [Gemmatimonadaceae bacterium]|nr:TolC family protein [Gemmatimonadaceae bacterium]
MLRLTLNIEVMRARIAIVVACAVRAMPALAQTTPLTRDAAVAIALDRGARLGVARADTAVANAQLITARALPNPVLSASYSKSLPNYHITADLPFDFPPVRSLRIRSAQLGLEAAQLRYRLAHATIVLDADTTYTHAVAAREHLALTRRNALDADSLLHMVERRRDLGDASEMDVQLARVNAGQQENLAAADSLTLVSSLLDLQAVLGFRSDELEVSATDSLGVPPEAAPPARATLSESAANLSLQSAVAAARLQHRSLWSSPSLSLGVEYGDPSQTGLLPTFGIGIGLPLFDRNRGQIAQAEAERVRAAAELTLAQVEARNEIAHGTRERANAIARVGRDRALVVSANTVAAMALTAYREGASALPNVLEAQRTARDVLGQYIDDLAAAWIATAELRVLALTPTSVSP